MAYTSRASRDLKRLDDSARRRIVDGIESHARTQAGDVKRLKGQSRALWRLRVGGWRVFFAYDPDTRNIVVTRIASRSQAYRT
ncbi:MAG: type II toxin-antitoxin system RelE/ParE family toxin [Gammaproteobacteria bacterium]|nr:type II toxin-antitoxin system RelE/ParE family toxin [Gammaproteobacteria bacterium]MDE0489415.1 type II toxin-antitoxin system RelE/ParE family toxin [Gammaproteobacteria bacterium]MXW20574.1 type II toxin-antitoxin system RelE/ParE family toxin [Gammaproteobacteria bacterium]